MSQSVVRILGFSLAIIGAVANVYCSVSVCAQTKSAKAGSSQTPALGKPPAIVTPSTNPSPTAAAPTKPTGQDGIDWETLDSDDHAGITRFRKWIYTRSDTVISGNTARYNRKTDTLDSDDPVVMNDPKHHLTADSVHVDHAQKNPSLRLVTLTGHAVMVLKPETASAPGEVPPAPVLPPGSSDPGRLKVVSISSQQAGAPPAGQGKSAVPPVAVQKQAEKPPVEDKDREDAKSQQRHGGTVTCDKIEYKTAKKFATLTGHVVFKQSFIDKDGKQIERTMTCEHAENDGKANMLHLFKPVHFEDSNGQKGDTQFDVKVGTKEGEETLSMGPTTMTFTSPDEDADDAEPKDSTPKTKKSTPDKSTSKATP